MKQLVKSGFPCCVVQGLSAFGIDRASLLSAGLSGEAVSLLYRALYVYTIGFQGKAKALVGQKHVLLNNIWRAYLAIAETAMEVGFKVSKGHNPSAHGNAI